jgi:hypothetical protein
MFRKVSSFLALFVLPVAVLMSPVDALADPADPEEVGHMKSGHKQVEGVVSEIKSGLYTVQTATGTTYTLTESAAVRQGREAPKVGDEMTLWVNEGNMVMDAHQKRGGLAYVHRSLSGTLVSIDYGQSQMTLSTAGGEKHFKLKPESRMFKNVAAGAHVRIEMNEAGEVIDVHEDKK